MKIFVVRLNPDLRKCPPYSRYPFPEEYKEIHQTSIMNGFHEAVNFLPENGVVKGYLPPKHLMAMRTDEPFILVTITAKTSKVGGDFIVGIQANCKYAGENKRRGVARESKSLNMTWHYYCQEALSLLLSKPIPNARKLILNDMKDWVRGPTRKISQTEFRRIIAAVKKVNNSQSEQHKLNRILKCATGDEKFYQIEFEDNSNFEYQVLDAMQVDLGDYIGNQHPDQKEVRTYQYVRSPLVVAYALKKANGICGDCGEQAPFVSKKTKLPYLEAHHISMLKDGGGDTIDNVIALCPNCHRKKHHG